MKNRRRKIDIVVISDVHLGTYGCHAVELLQYLKSIKPKIVVLNGDIIDIWQFSKTYWPNSHMKVVRHLMNWLTRGIKIHYITGNHDEMMRKFVGFKLGSLSILNKIVLELGENKKAWIFHGDVFDVTMQHSKWLAKLGAIGYDMLIIINSVANFISGRIFGRGKLSFSKRIKNSVKTAVKFINNFEQTAADIGISNHYDYVICGHIHQPEMRTLHNPHGSIIYLNSGDWVENLTALEYVDGTWRIYRYNADDFIDSQTDSSEDADLTSDQLFENLLQEFKLQEA